MYQPVADLDTNWEFTKRHGLNHHTTESRLIIETLRKTPVHEPQYKVFLRRLLQLPVVLNLNGRDCKYMQIGKRIGLTYVDQQFPKNVYEILHTEKDKRWIYTKHVLDTYSKVFVPAASLVQGLVFLESEDRDNTPAIESLEKEFLNLEWIVEDGNKFKAVLFNEGLYLVGPNPYVL